jgi:quinol-cytochrome oxidoreductase complex cytochrome b subunit
MHHMNDTTFLYLLSFLALLCFFVAVACSIYLLWDFKDERRQTRREYARQKRLQNRHRPRKRRDKNLHRPYRRR